MSTISQERSEVMRLLRQPPERLTQSPALARFDVECGNGPKILRIARRVCTLHNLWSDVLDSKNRKMLDERLIQASIAVKVLLECHNDELPIDCNVESVETLREKISDKLVSKVRSG